MPRRGSYCYFLTLSMRSAAVLSVLLAFTPNSSTANPGFGSNLSLKSNVRHSANSGPFQVSPTLRARVDFWKDIFTKFGPSHSVIHHRDFPQLVFGVIDLSREREAMSKISFEAYKSEAVKRSVDDVKRQMLQLADGQGASTDFQQRLLSQLEERGLPPRVLRDWIEQDLIRTQTGIRERYAEAVRRAWRYLPVMEQIFSQEYGLPKELTRIPFIESSFDYTAYSSVGAAGIWQFMPRTARAHRMLVGRYVDDRRDPIKATRAAAEYLRQAYNSLGSWPLAITSYNHGVGGVRSKVRKAGTSDLATIIEDPSERYFGFASTNFYPEFLAAVEIFNDHERYFPEVREEPPLQVAAYRLTRPASAQTIANRLGISAEDLKEANYGLLDPIWSGRAAIPAGYSLRVPISLRERADRLFGGGDAAYAAPPNQPEPRIVQVSGRPSGSLYTVKRGESIDSIARKFGIPTGDIVRSNSLRSSKVASGQQLRIVRVSGQSEGHVQTQPQKAARYVTVKPGDTVGSIATKNRVSVDRLRAVNAIRSNKIVVGQKLRLP
jgi:membrane-bound lytic murein transglycosylase D